ncbi:MAG TPA: PaaI family thioesterase [Pyrinomonadaceae bacterium]|nr:PaaI family thioesterase [Pyrinomonadaceae bacterium]
MDERPLTPEELERIRAAFARVPYARLLGIELLRVERGAATLTLNVREELTRMEGIVHGGALASLLDTAAAFAVISTLEPGQRTVTVDLTIHYLRPATSDTRLHADARILRAGRRLVIVAIEAKDQHGDLISTATTTYVKQG